LDSNFKKKLRPILNYLKKILFRQVLETRLQFNAKILFENASQLTQNQKFEKKKNIANFYFYFKI
jgi:hypothetical protein